MPCGLIMLMPSLVRTCKFAWRFYPEDQYEIHEFILVLHILKNIHFYYVYVVRYVNVFFTHNDLCYMQRGKAWVTRRIHHIAPNHWQTTGNGC